MTRIGCLVVAVLLVIARLCPAEDHWQVFDTGAPARLRGLAVADAKTVWASGTGGTVVLTTDAGASWRVIRVPGAEALDFRDIEAFDGTAAVALASGEGPASKIYRTEDGGRTWSPRFTNPDPKGFLDAIAFWDPDHGLAMGDPVDGRFALFATEDGGKTWARLRPEVMPPALPGEGAFAASGTCLVTVGDRLAFFATGGAGAARVFRTEDRGRMWAAHRVWPGGKPTASAGIFSLAFRDESVGIAVGGDYQKPDDRANNVALTSDGGRTWGPPHGEVPSGYRSGVAAFVTERPGPGDRTGWVAVGPNGSDRAFALGSAWNRLDGPGFHAVRTDPKSGAVWAAGDDGRVGRLVPSPR